MHDSTYRLQGKLLTSGCALFLALGSILGCVRPVGPRTPEENERKLFDDTSAFYCREKRWPASLTELDPAGTSSPPEPVVFANSVLTTTRAVTLTIDYTTAEGTPKKVTFIAPPYCGTEPPEGVVSMAGGRVVFRIPKEFGVLDVAGIEERWKTPPFPDVAWERSESSVVVAVRFGETDLSVESLKQLKSALEKSYAKSAQKLQWIERTLVEDGKVPHLRHEFESDSQKGRLVTVALSMPFDGKLLSINVAGPIGNRGEIDAVAETILGTLGVN